MRQLSQLQEHVVFAQGFIFGVLGGQGQAIGNPQEIHIFAQIEQLLFQGLGNALFARIDFACQDN